MSHFTTSVAADFFVSQITQLNERGEAWGTSSEDNRWNIIVIKVDLVHRGGMLNKPKWAVFNMMMFLKDVVSSRNVPGNIAPLEKPRQDQQLEQWDIKNWNYHTMTVTLYWRYMEIIERIWLLPYQNYHSNCHPILQVHSID